MKILDFLNEKAVIANLEAADKNEAIAKMVDLLVKAGEVEAGSKDNLFKALLDREALGSTGIGQGIAIPHCKNNSVKKLIASFAIAPKGINFESLDGEPVNILFLLVAPEDSAGPHLKALARISRLLKDKFFRDSLINVESLKNLLTLIKDEDNKHE